MTISPAPTSKLLDADSLLAIIDLITSQIPNAFTEIDRPLDIVRAASQVCQQWRRLLVGSQWIWGRVIDLGVDNSDQVVGRGEWLEEVLKRAGSTRLWIYGNIDEPQPEESGVLNTLALFVRVLESWDRVEKLSVNIYTSTIPSAIQTRFLSRAPHLKLFDVFTPYIMGPLFINTVQQHSSVCLFSDYAPSLQQIKARRISIKIDSSWLPGIRIIDPMPTTLNIHDICLLLKRTPLLESVGFDLRDPNLYVGDICNWSKPDLPNLSSIGLMTTLEASAKILGYILPQKLSFFCLDITDPTTTLVDGNIVSSFSDSIVSSFRQNLPFYIAAYCASAPSVAVRLQLTDVFFWFHEIGMCARNQRSNFGICMNDARLTCLDHDQLHTLVVCLLDTFIQASQLPKGSLFFEPVTEIVLDLYGPGPAIWTNIHSMLMLFRHIQYLGLHEYAGHTLWDILSHNPLGDNHSGIPFPQLHTVYLRSYPGPVNTLMECHGLTEFLLYRSRIGFPITKLDLTYCRNSRYARDLSALEGAGGLEIVGKRPRVGKNVNELSEEFEVCSYICGSGDPQQLKGLWKEW